MISRRHFALLPFGAAGISCRKSRGDGYNGYAFVANQEGNAVAAVDLTAFAAVKHIRLADAPTQVISHGERRAIYVLTPATGKIHEIDPAKLAVKRSVWLGGPAASMMLEPGGNCLWALSGSGKRLLRVAFEPFQVSAEIRLPYEPSSFDLGAYFGARDWVGMAAVGYGKQGAVSLIHLQSGEVRKTSQLEGEIGSVRFRGDGKSVLVGDLDRRQLTVLDSPGGNVVVHLPLAVRPDHFCFHPNGGQLFITGEGRDAVVVVYPYFVPEVAETVLAGSRPGAMAATSSHLFVTNPPSGDLSILNITRRRVIAVTTVGTNPGYVTVTPDGEYVLVLNQTSGDMAVIRIAGLRPDRRKTAALFTMIPVGSGPVSAAIASA